MPPRAGGSSYEEGRRLERRVSHPVRSPFQEEHPKVLERDQSCSKINGTWDHGVMSIWLCDPTASSTQPMDSSADPTNIRVP